MLSESCSPSVSTKLFVPSSLSPSTYSLLDSHSSSFSSSPSQLTITGTFFTLVTFFPALLGPVEPATFAAAASNNLFDFAAFVASIASHSSCRCTTSSAVITLAFVRWHRCCAAAAEVSFAPERKFLIISTPNSLSARAPCAALSNWPIQLCSMREDGDWWVMRRQALRASLSTGLDYLGVVVGGVSAQVISPA